MPEKKTISGRVPADTEQRFERFRRQRGLNKTDALRRLLDAGLDSYERQQMGEARPDAGRDSTTSDSTATDDVDDTDDIDTWLLTRGEEWFSSVFRSALAGVILTAPATLGLWITWTVLDEVLTVNAVEWFPTQLLALAILAGLMAFVVLGAVSVAAYGALKLGVAERLEGQAAEVADA